ncbi:hypothetical protein [Amycolatopsis minnesotensis]|uniref:hypothetical protein n=1 Tax=Amycolatopsis minnesotensis TaxID=337894 RepID=UPI0031DCF61B
MIAARKAVSQPGEEPAKSMGWSIPAAALSEVDRCRCWTNCEHVNADPVPAFDLVAALSWCAWCRGRRCGSGHACRGRTSR